MAYGLSTSGEHDSIMQRGVTATGWHRATWQLLAHDVSLTVWCTTSSAS